MLTRTEVKLFWVGPARQKCGHNSKNEKIKLAAILKMVEAEIPANTDFEGHGHLQYSALVGTEVTHCDIKPILY